MTAPELLKAELPLVRFIESELAECGYVRDTEAYNETFDHLLAFYRQFGWRQIIVDTI
jgi:hypothetical protein